MKIPKVGAKKTAKRSTKIAVPAVDVILVERLVIAWETIAKGIGEFNDIARTAIAKQWPEASERREAIVSRVPSAEDKFKAQTGNTDGPLEDWLGEFDPEEEIGPREKAWRDAHGGTGHKQPSSSPKTPPKAS